MTCPYCGGESNNYDYCPNCGANLTELKTKEQAKQEVIVNNPQPVQQPTTTNNNSNNRRKKTSTASTFILILIIAGIIFGYKMLNKSAESNSSDGSSESSSTAKTDDKTDTENPFFMYIDDKYYVRDCGTVVTGTVLGDGVSVGDKVQLVNKETGKKINTEVLKIETYRKELKTASEGDSVGICIKDIDRTDVNHGDVLAAVDTVTITNNFEAELSLYETGYYAGRDKSIKSGYNPYLKLSDNTTLCEITILDDVKEAKPGDKVKVKVQLADAIPMRNGLNFDIKEASGYTGEGVITSVKEKNNNILPAGTTIFDAEVHVNSKTDDKDGLSDTMALSNVVTKPQFFFGNNESSGIIEVYDADKLNPGEDGKIKVTLNANMSINVGDEFEIREGNIKAGKGKVTKVY